MSVGGPARFNVAETPDQAILDAEYHIGIKVFVAIDKDVCDQGLAIGRADRAAAAASRSWSSNNSGASA
jgi:hypothetical protein